MFADFSDVWSPIAIASAVKRNAALRVVVAKTPIVLFRDAAGTLSALLDRCPHRGVALSLGQVRDGCVVCPFHGWELDGSGAVRHVPWNPDDKRASLRGVSFPVAERAGLVWLFTGTGSAPAMPEAAAQLLRPELRLTWLELPFQTHWTRLMENMLDWPHLPFVHANTIGRGMLGGRQSRLDIDWRPTETGFHSTIAVDGTAKPGSLEFRWPNQMVLDVPAPGKTFVLFNFCVPEDDGSSRLLAVMARSFLKLAALDPIFNWSNARIAREDKRILESSFPAEVPHPSSELSVRTDAPVLYFRKRYLEELKKLTPRRLPRAPAAVEPG